MMWMAAWSLIALLLGACATVPVLGSSPRFVTIDIGSELRFEPLRAEALADSAIRDLVEQCERQGYPGCRDRIIGVDTQTRFAPPRDTTVVVLITLGEVEPGRRYVVVYRLFDPKGEIRGRSMVVHDLPRRLPPNFVWRVHFTWSQEEVRKWDRGRWRVEISINGVVEGDRTFEVVEWGAATTRQRCCNEMPPHGAGTPPGPGPSPHPWRSERDEHSYDTTRELGATASA
jgi:hypothetical protein